MNKGPGAEEKFKEISAAYEVTSTFLSLQNLPLVFFFCWGILCRIGNIMKFCITLSILSLVKISFWSFSFIVFNLTTKCIFRYYQMMRKGLHMTVLVRQGCEENMMCRVAVHRG